MLFVLPGLGGLGVGMTASAEDAGKAIATVLTASEGVTYTSSNPQLLRVDKDGNVTFSRLCIFCRSATITAVSADGSKSASCEIIIRVKWWQYLIWLLLGSFWF